MVVLGTGLLKPNISAIVGGLYDKNSDRKEAGFTIFYMSINIGSILRFFYLWIFRRKHWMALWFWSSWNWNGFWLNSIYVNKKKSRRS